MTDNKPTDVEKAAAEKDARIAELEAELAAKREEAPASEKTVRLKHSNGTKVEVGASQADGLKSAGFTK